MQFNYEGLQNSLKVLLSASKQLDGFPSGEKTQRSIKKDVSYSRCKSSMKCLNNAFAFSLINKSLLNHSFCKPLFKEVFKSKTVSAYQSPQNP